MAKPLPVGVDDFGKIISKGYYYVDKTLFIKELLDKKGEVNLFMRPRRFGKTLTLSMIRYFFEDTGETGKNQANQALFKGLQIMEQGERYLQEMCGYPVVNLSLKSAKQPNWELAYGSLKEAIGEEYLRHRNVVESLDTPEQRRRYEDVMNLRGSRQDFISSIWFLSKSLYQHYGKKVIILIDEYDVPLENAFFSGFYDEMIGFIRSIFESALKTNPYLEFAVITGCLRITKESIFTGLNNLKMISILNPTYSEYFGFTQKEINEILECYGLLEQCSRIEAWYNGYLFGGTKVYNPWSVMNYIEVLFADPNELPSPYWANTSSNSIVRHLIENADPSVKSELEVLLAGGTIEKAVHEEITYDSVYDSEDNLWNFLFFTGYLKLISRRLEGENRYITMGIPNLEVKYIYSNMIENWFVEKMKSRDLSPMYQAMQDGNAEVFENELTELLQESISYMDAKEAFYHGFLLGVLSNMSNYVIKSNRESGNGRLDIVVRSLDIKKAPIIMEIKVSETFKDMGAACDRAIQQIVDMKYDSWVQEDGYTEVLDYGIAFFRKRCKIKLTRRQFI